MKNILKKVTGNRGSLIIIGLVAVGVLLLMFPSDKDEPTDVSSDTLVTVSTYTERIEEKIRALCMSVDGVKDVSVLVTLESGSEYVYADNKKEDFEGDSGASSYTSDYLIVENKDGTSPVIITEVYPKIRGVAVVWKGTGTSIQVKLTELLSAALGVPTNRIKVTS